MSGQPKKHQEEKVRCFIGPIEEVVEQVGVWARKMSHYVTAEELRVWTEQFGSYVRDEAHHSHIKGALKCFTGYHEKLVRAYERWKRVLTSPWYATMEFGHPAQKRPKKHRARKGQSAGHQVPKGGGKDDPKKNGK